MAQIVEATCYICRLACTLPRYFPSVHGFRRDDLIGALLPVVASEAVLLMRKNVVVRFGSRPTREQFAVLMERETIWDIERSFGTRVLNLQAAKFDIWAKRACHVVCDENDLRVYDRWLFDYAQAWLDAEKNMGHQAILPDLRSQLIERMEHWKAVGRRYLTSYRAELEKLTEQPSKRLKATVVSRTAARKMEKYLDCKGIGQTDFATTVGTTDRTLRSFRKTGKVRRDILESIAKHMGTTKEALLED